MINYTGVLLLCIESSIRPVAEIARAKRFLFRLLYFFFLFIPLWDEVVCTCGSVFSYAFMYVGRYTRRDVYTPSKADNNGYLFGMIYTYNIILCTGCYLIIYFSATILLLI